MTVETWPMAKKSTFELRQIDSFSTAVDSFWKVDVSMGHPLSVEKFLHEVYQFENLKGLTTSVVRCTLKPKIGQYQLWYI